MQLNKFIISLTVLILTSSNAFAIPFFSGNKKPATPAAINPQTEEVSPKEVDPNNFSGVAILQGLNKITAKTSDLRVPVGGQVEFGKLIIKAEKCWKSAPDQRPENKILLQIDEIQADGSKKSIFHGWMFSSSPSISGIEDPIYDITAIACK
jgi:hypothetical protein